MLPRDGIVLVKIQSSPNVYYLDENPENKFMPILRLIPSETVAKKLFGRSWADYVIDISPTFFTKFNLLGATMEVEDAASINLFITDKTCPVDNEGVISLSSEAGHGSRTQMSSFQDTMKTAAVATA